jgi:hypothetical protein
MQRLLSGLSSCRDAALIQIISRYRALVGKPEGRRPLERPRCRWEDNIKMDLREFGWGAWTGFI